jgi:hypothetical protein
MRRCGQAIGSSFPASATAPAAALSFQAQIFLQQLIDALGDLLSELAPAGCLLLLTILSCIAGHACAAPAGTIAWMTADGWALAHLTAPLPDRPR